MSTRAITENLYYASTSNWMEILAISDSELDEKRLHEIHSEIQTTVHSLLKQKENAGNYYSLDVKMFVNESYNRLLHVVINISHFPNHGLQGFIAVGPNTQLFAQGIINVPPKPNPPAP